MFTDTEMALMIAHKRNADGIVADANAIIDSKDARIAALEARLVREQGKNRNLVLERGQRNAELLASRIGRRRH